MMKNLKLTAVLVFAAGCATVRPITYPSPCEDRYNPRQCEITGYEVWGSPSQVQAQAKRCPKSAHVTIDPHRDYGVVRCYAPFEVDEAESVVVVEDDDEPPPDQEFTLQEAEEPVRPKVVPTAVQPEPEVRDQPRVEPPKKVRARHKRRTRSDDADD